MQKGRFSLLVLGAGRSGTSLVAGLLDAHTQLRVASEHHAPRFLMGQALGLWTRSLVFRLRGFLWACKAEARRSPLPWGNKITTEQLDMLPGRSNFPRLAKRVSKALFQRRKVVFVLRDPRSCIQSKMDRSGCNFVEGRARYRQSLQWLDWLWARREDLDLHLILFESLLLEPQEELERLCAFLSLPFDPAMLRGTANIRLREEYRRPTLLPAKAEPKPAAQALAPQLRTEMERYQKYQSIKK